MKKAEMGIFTYFIAKSKFIRYNIYCKKNDTRLVML